MSVSLYLKGARRSSRPDLTVGLKTFYHHISLVLILPEVTEEYFLIRIILANPLQTSLYPTLDAPLVERQPKVEELPVVAVVVTDSCPSGEAPYTTNGSRTCKKGAEHIVPANGAFIRPCLSVGGLTLQR